MKKITVYSLLVALTVALSSLIVLPLPASNGFISLVDAGIFTSALLFGPSAGLVVGALSGGLIDLLAGYAHWILPSILIHGAQGYVTGRFYQSSRGSKLWGLFLGSLIMVVGYGIVSGLAFTWPVALADTPLNILQVLVGSSISYPLHTYLKKVLPAHIFNP